MSKADIAAEAVAEVVETEASEQAAEALAAEGEQITRLVSLVTRAQGLIGRMRTAVGIRVDRGAFLKAEQGESWQDWALSLVPDKFDVYKARQAGAVGRVLDLQVPDLGENVTDLEAAGAAIGHLPGYLVLLPGYRLIKEARAEKDPAQRAKAIKRAEENIRKAWADLTADGNEPTEAESIKRFGRFGSKAPAAEKNEPQDRNEPTDPNGSLNETMTVTLDTAGMESLTQDIGGQIKAWTDEFKLPRETIVSIMLGTIRFGTERGFENVRVILSK